MKTRAEAADPESGVPERERTTKGRGLRWTMETPDGAVTTKVAWA